MQRSDVSPLKTFANPTIPDPLRILLAMLGAAASPIDKLRKDSALPTVTSEKSILFKRI